MEKLGFSRANFHGILYLRIFRKSAEKCLQFILKKKARIDGTYTKTNVHLRYLAEFFVEGEAFQKSYKENRNSHFMSSNYFVAKNRAV